MVLIKGLAIKLGERNQKGQGIPISEKKNFMNSLRSAVVRISPPVSEHFEDRMRNPDAVIGSIKKVWDDGNKIYAAAEINDYVANREINRGSWAGMGWSPFATVKDWTHGLATGVNVEALSLVENPAEVDALWEVASSASNILPFFNKFYSASRDEIMTEEVKENGAGDPSKVVEDNPGKVEEKQEGTNFEELVSKNEELIKQNTEQGATIEELKAEIEKLKTMSASMYPRDEVDLKVKAALQQHKEAETREAYMASIEKDFSVLKKPFTASEFDDLSLANLEAHKNRYNELAASASVLQADNIKYGASASEKSTGPVFEAGKGWS